MRLAMPFVWDERCLAHDPRSDPRDRTRPQILSGETPDAVRIPSGCRFHPRCPVAIDDCSRIDPVLERPRNARTPDHRAACILA